VNRPLLLLDQGQEPKEFWDLLGGKGAIADGSSGGDDKAVVSKKKLFRLTDGMEGPAPVGNFNPAPVSHTEVSPTVKGSPTFDVAKDVDTLKKSIGFFGTKGNAIVDILGGSTFEQRQQLREAYQKATGDDLVKKLEAKTSFNFKKTLLTLFNPPRLNDAISLRAAVKVKITPSLLSIQFCDCSFDPFPSCQKIQIICSNSKRDSGLTKGA